MPPSIVISYASHLVHRSGHIATGISVTDLCLRQNTPIYLGVTVGTILEQQHFLFSFDEARFPCGGTQKWETYRSSDRFQNHFSVPTLDTKCLRESFYGSTAPITGGLE